MIAFATTTPVTLPVLEEKYDYNAAASENFSDISYMITEIKWRKYKKTLRHINDQNVSSLVIENLEEIETFIRKHFVQSTIPNVCPCDESNGLEISWDMGNNLVSFEIFTDGKIDWFIRFRDTNQYYGQSDENRAALFQNEKLISLIKEIKTNTKNV